MWVEIDFITFLLRHNCYKDKRMARVHLFSKDLCFLVMTQQSLVYLLLLFGLFSTVDAVPKNLSIPEPALCASRKSHFRLGSSSYYVSWLEKDTRNLFLNWLDARNWCRDRCMDLISMETADEINTVKLLMKASK